MSYPYSDDRESLAREIRGTLKARGLWCPETSGPDLINAVAKALDTVAWRPVSDPPEMEEDCNGSGLLESVYVQTYNATDGSQAVAWAWKNVATGSSGNVYWTLSGGIAGTVKPTHWRPLGDGPK